jgi:ERCC4-type nuclease
MSAISRPDVSELGANRCLPGVHRLANLADCRPILVVDCREQVPLDFANLTAVSGTLYAGDYSLCGLEASFAVERKSIDDLANCCLAAQRGRFEHELHRLRGYRFNRLLIAGTRSDIAACRYYSRISPKAVLATLGAFEVRSRFARCVRDEHCRSGGLHRTLSHFGCKRGGPNHPFQARYNPVDVSRIA